MEDVCDPSDWPVKSLADMDSSLRCPICKEFFTNAVSIKCGHSFCSLCIRRCLAADKNCPSCRVYADDVSIRRNTILDELVTRFQIARPILLEMIRDSIAKSESRPVSSSECSTPFIVPDSPTPQRSYSTRGAKRKRNEYEASISNHKPTGSPDLVNTAVPNQSQNADSNATPTTNVDGDELKLETIVSCPICNASMTFAEINQHINTCANTVADANNPCKSSSPLMKCDVLHSMRNHTQTRMSKTKSLPSSILKKMPKLPYPQLSESQIRKKCVDAGIRTFGDKKTLVDRHKQYTLMHNANLDGENPLPLSFIRQQLEEWEDVQAKNKVIAAAAAASASMKSDEQVRRNLELHQQTYKDEFERLISKAKHTQTPLGSDVKSEVDQKADIGDIGIEKTMDMDDIGIEKAMGTDDKTMGTDDKGIEETMGTGDKGIEETTGIGDIGIENTLGSDDKGIEKPIGTDDIE